VHGLFEVRRFDEVDLRLKLTVSRGNRIKMY
jgi:hypothetical protein